MNTNDISQIRLHPNWGHILKSLRESCGYTREFVTEKTGIDFKRLKRLENQIPNEPYNDELQRLCLLYSVNSSIFFSSDEPLYHELIQKKPAQQSVSFQEVENRILQQLIDYKKEDNEAKKAAKHQRLINVLSEFIKASNNY